MTRNELLTAYKAGKRDFGGAYLGGADLGGADLGGILNSIGAKVGQDFHTLSSTQVESLLAWADHYRYRKPKNANGSRGYDLGEG